MIELTKVLSKSMDMAEATKRNQLNRGAAAGWYIFIFDVVLASFSHLNKWLAVIISMNVPDSISWKVVSEKEMKCKYTLFWYTVILSCAWVLFYSYTYLLLQTRKLRWITYDNIESPTKICNHILQGFFWKHDAYICKCRHEKTKIVFWQINVWSVRNIHVNKQKNMVVTYLNAFRIAFDFIVIFTTLE